MQLNHPELVLHTLVSKLLSEVVGEGSVRKIGECVPKLTY